MNDLQHRGTGRTTLRVDIVTETYPPEVNGAAATVQRMVEGLARRGHSVRLVRPRQRAPDRGSDDIHTTFIPGLPLPDFGEFHMSLPALGRLTKLWDDAPPDVIYVATEGPLGWAAVRLAGAKGIPVVSGIHTRFQSLGNAEGRSLLRKSVYEYLRGLHNRTHCTLVPTKELQRALGRDFHNLRVLERGIDTELFSPRRRDEALRRSWGAGPADRVVLCVGRLAAHKNLPLALRTFHAMQATERRVRFVVVGSGPMYQEIFRPYEGLIFAGTRTGEDLAAHYASADIFLFPSETEAFGNVTLEAMASGLAVVAYDHAAPRLLIRSGESGLLVPLGDEPAFTAAAVSLLHDPKRLARLRDEARRAVAGRDWNTVLDRFEHILHQCSAKTERPAANAP